MRIYWRIGEHIRRAFHLYGIQVAWYQTHTELEQDKGRATFGTLNPVSNVWVVHSPLYLRYSLNPTSRRMELWHIQEAREIQNAYLYVGDIEGNPRPGDLIEIPTPDEEILAASLDQKPYHPHGHIYKIKDIQWVGEDIEESVIMALTLEFLRDYSEIFIAEFRSYWDKG